MATLENIRKHSTLLLIVIGLALLAFILGDVLSRQNLFTNTDTAAKVGGEKIGIMEFQERLNAASQRMQGRNIDPAVLQQEMLNRMVEESLINQETEALGIEVSKAELTEFTTGKFAQQTAQLAQQFGLSTPTELLDAINNPQAFCSKMQIPADSQSQVVEMLGNAKKQWKEIEDGTIMQLKAMKLQRLIAGTLPANKLDVAAVNANNVIYSVNVVKKQFHEIADSTITVTDDELKARYEQDKNMFKVKEETRNLDYLAILIRPSAADEASAKAMFDQAYASLGTENGLVEVKANDELVVEEKTSTLAKVTDNELKSFLETAAVGAVSPEKTAGYNYAATKLLAKTMEVDSVNVTLVRVDGKKAQQDSILNLLTAGTAPDSIKADFVQANPATWYDLTAMENNDSIKNKFANAALNTYFVVDSQEQGAIIAKVSEKKAPKSMYKYATVSYKLEASDETIADLRTKFQKYVSANGNVKDLTANVAKCEVPVQPASAVVAVGTPQINGMNDTRKAIKWAFDAKQGNVSAIFETDKDDQGAQYLIAVGVRSIIKKGFAPLEEVKDIVKQRVLADKKADVLVKQFTDAKQNTLAGYAAALKTTVDSTSVSFSNPSMALVGRDGKLAGKIVGSKVGVVSAPVKGNMGVYVYQVTKVDNEGVKLSDEEAANRFMFSGARLVGGYGSPLFVSILLEKHPVDNYLIKFY